LPASPPHGAGLPFAHGLQATARPGNGDGVLWIHGYTLDSTTWDEIWCELPGWSHHGIDLPGHGMSPAMEPGMTLGELGQRLAQAAIAHDVRHIVGLSVGSIIALEAALSRPLAFETVTLAAPALAGGPVADDVGVRFRELQELYRRRGHGPWMTELWMRCPPATFAGASPPLHARLAEVIDRYAWSELSNPERGIAALARARQDPHRLRTSTARILVIVGEHELPAFRDTAAILHGIRQDARLVELAGAGHLCLLHAPRQSARLISQHWQDRTAAGTDPP